MPCVVRRIEKNILPGRMNRRPGVVCGVTGWRSLTARNSIPSRAVLKPQKGGAGRVASRERPFRIEGGHGIASLSCPWPACPVSAAVLAAVQADPAARAHLFGPRPRLARH
jgi:hypothetical protein